MLTSKCLFPCADNGFPAWGVGAALIPALLATVLFFVEQHITEAIVNKKDNKLKVRGVYISDAHCDSGILKCRCNGLKSAYTVYNTCTCQGYNHSNCEVNSLQQYVQYTCRLE